MKKTAKATAQVNAMAKKMGMTKESRTTNSVIKKGPESHVNSQKSFMKSVKM